MAVKERVGLVVSDKMDKTVVVAVENRSPHPKYRKIVVQTKRYKVHDEENQCQVGDRVRIRETRPLSRTKRWTVVDVLGDTVDSVTPQATTTATQSPPEAAPTSESLESVNQPSELDEQGEEQ